MTSPNLRFGLHDFLNALPLLNPLLEHGEQANLKAVVDVPSALADRLKSGDLDLAMIPTVEYLKNAEYYRLAPGPCIASRGEVGTVLFITRVTLDKIRSIAVDCRSRTSAALLKILFADDFSPNVDYSPASPGAKEMLRGHDAALIIGDEALRVENLGVELKIIDLSEEWFRRTGKTFVHAVVAVRPDVRLLKETLDFLRGLRFAGLEQIDSIIKDYSDRTGMNVKMCEDYLQKKIIYSLGEEELEGLLHFRDLCQENQLIPDKHPVTFIQ